MVQQTMRSPIIGLGPSAATEAADGYYLRVFVESGILGVLVFVGLVFSEARSSLRAARRATGLAKSLAVAALAATVFISLVGVLIDTWVASRVMELVWPLIGLSLAAVALQREVSNTTDQPWPASRSAPPAASSCASRAWRPSKSCALIDRAASAAPARRCGGGSRAVRR
jgi:F0F1-type ATP synthase assembly protein I